MYVSIRPSTTDYSRYTDSDSVARYTKFFDFSHTFGDFFSPQKIASEKLLIFTD